MSTVAGTCGMSGSSNGAAGTFDTPAGVDVKSSNDVLYIADTGNHLVRAIQISDGTVSTIAGVDGVPGLINEPHGIKERGTVLYVACRGNGYVVRVSLTGECGRVPSARNHGLHPVCRLQSRSP